MSLPISLVVLLFAGPAKPQTLASDSLPGCEVRGSQAWLSSRASPLDSTVISVDGRYAKVCYSRPSARGRSVYDSLAPFGKVWRTGANEPTLLLVTRPLEVAGVRLDAGRYLLLTIPGAERWIVLFNHATGTDPAEMFQTMEEYGRGSAVAEQLSAPVEQFTIRAETRDGAALLMEWGSLRARLPVRVPHVEIRAAAPTTSGDEAGEDQEHDLQSDSQAAQGARQREGAGAECQERRRERSVRR